MFSKGCLLIQKASSSNKTMLLDSGKKMFSSQIKKKMEQKVAERLKIFNQFKKDYQNEKIGEITTGQIIGGMRGMPAILYETSKLHRVQGIRYRRMDLYEIRDSAPKAEGGSQPLPEGVLWLLLTGEFPNDKELREFQEELHARSKLSEEAEALLKNLPKDMHPMT